MAQTIKTLGPINVRSRAGSNSDDYQYRIILTYNSQDTTNRTANINVKFQVQGFHGYEFKGHADTNAAFTVTTSAGESFDLKSNLRNSHSVSTSLTTLIN